jgi:hypothetical protein
VTELPLEHADAILELLEPIVASPAAPPAGPARAAALLDVAAQPFDLVLHDLELTTLILHRATELPILAD